MQSARTLPSFHCMFLYQLCSLILVFLSLFHSHLGPFTFSTIIHTNAYFYSWVCLRLSVVPPMKMSTLRMVSHGVVLCTTPVNKRCMHIYQTLLLLELHTAIHGHLITFTFLSKPLDMSLFWLFKISHFTECYINKIFNPLKKKLAFDNFMVVICFLYRKRLATVVFFHIAGKNLNKENPKTSWD